MSMKMKIQLTIETEGGEKITTQEVAELERTDLQAETLGLTLAEAKTVLHKLQEAHRCPAGGGLHRRSATLSQLSPCTRE